MCIRDRDIICHRYHLRPAHTVPGPGQRPGRCGLPGVAAYHRKAFLSFHCKAPSHMLGVPSYAAVSYTHLDVYKRQA